LREIRLRRIPAAAIPLSIVLTIALACGRSSRDVVPNSGAHILVFVGSGTSPSDLVAFERVLTDGGFGYSTATSRELAV
jgi:hypothetical protein